MHGGRRSCVSRSSVTRCCVSRAPSPDAASADAASADAVVGPVLGLPATPGPRVLPVVDGPATLTELERTEGVDHDGELVEVLDADRRLRRTGLGAVRVTT